MTATLAMAVGLVVALLGWQLRPTPRSRSPLLHSTPPTPRSRRRRRATVDTLSIATHLESVSRELRTGAALSGALGAVIPADSMGTAVFDDVRELVHDGCPVGEALAGMRAPGLHPDVALAVEALACAAAFGGPAAATLDGSAAVLRERAAIAADSRAQSAQARLSARILTVVPIGFALWTLAGSARTRSALTSAIGVACLGAGASLNIGGWWWMRRIVDRGQR